MYYRQGVSVYHQVLSDPQRADLILAQAIDHLMEQVKPQLGPQIMPFEDQAEELRRIVGRNTLFPQNIS